MPREGRVVVAFLVLLAGCSSLREPAEADAVVEPAAVVEAPPPAESSEPSSIEPSAPPALESAPPSSAESPTPPSEDSLPPHPAGADPLFARLSGHWTGRDEARGEEYHLNVSVVRGCFVGTLSILTPASVVCVVEAACEEHGENEVRIAGPCIGDEGPMAPVGCSLSLDDEGRMRGEGCFEVPLERVQ